MRHRELKLERMWNGRPDSWHTHVNESDVFCEIRSRVLAAARVCPHERVVDLGAGTGFLALAVAQSATSVLAIDLSAAMLDEFRRTAVQQSVANIEIVQSDLRSIDLAPRSVDVIVTSYALHHLKDRDKAALVRRASNWLRPGGRIVIADMMFGRGGTKADRAIIRSKMSALWGKGPAGVWRIAKNLVRFGLRVGTELPSTSTFWCEQLSAAGFAEVRYFALRAEAGLVMGTMPVSCGDETS